MIDNTFKVKLIQKYNLNHKVVLFKFQISENYDFSFIPGQFVSLFLKNEEGELLRRSYSIANFNFENNTIELAITIVENGTGTHSLLSLNIDEEIQAKGPLGKFVFKNNIPGRHIFIGTGTGIVPYKSMINQIESFLNDENNFVVVIQGVQTREEILFIEDFKELKKFSNFDFKVALSQEKIFDNKEKYEISGHVQNCLEDILLNPEKDTIYLCGNPYMIEDVSNLLEGKKFTSDRIVTERYFPKKKVI